MTNLSSLKLVVADAAGPAVALLDSVDDRNRMADDPKWLIKFDDELDDDNEEEGADGS